MIFRAITTILLIALVYLETGIATALSFFLVFFAIEAQSWLHDQLVATLRKNEIKRAITECVIAMNEANEKKAGIRDGYKCESCGGDGIRVGGLPTAVFQKGGKE